jgi:glutamine amidotransferase
MIAIIDYGAGNLRSVEKAFNFIGHQAMVSADREFILNADGIVLPGVGAFADAMNSLGHAGMIELVKKCALSGKPFLGICLGMQLLFDYSCEGGYRVPGLGILGGEIRKFPHDLGLKVPQMGWNRLNTRENSILFKGMSQELYVYFVHSYYLEASDKSIVSAAASYGVEFDAAVESGNIFAVQFHPEKSGDVGLSILKNWACLTGKE